MVMVMTIRRTAKRREEMNAAFDKQIEKMRVDESVSTKHTPTPWSVDGHPRDSSGSDWREITAATEPYGPSFVGSVLEANAELIVRAVNSHNALVAALGNLIEYAAGLELMLRAHEIEFNDSGQIETARATLSTMRAVK